MNRAPIWFERKFEFTFPVEMYPNVCARLRGTPARLEEVFHAAPLDHRIRKPGGKWSAQEHAGHLLNVEPLWLSRLDDYVAGAEMLTATDLSNRKTDEARYNQRSIDDILAEFRVERTRLLKRVENVDPAIFSRSSLHPRMKTPMRLVDHLYFVAEHDDHHLAYIWDLLRAG